MRVVFMQAFSSPADNHLDPVIVKELQDKDRLIESLRQQLIERDKVINTLQSRLQYIQGVADDELAKAIQENSEATLLNLRGLEAGLVRCLDQVHQFKILKVEKAPEEGCKCCQK